MVGENFDISLGHHETISSPGRPESGGEAGPAGEAASERRFIGVRFRCCGTYARAYLNKARTIYQGNCPKCSKPIRFKVGPGGTDSRFFEVY
jgi:hypothetical protein